MTNDSEDRADGTWSADDLAAPLATIRFLEGTWRGEGQGPYGPYELHATATVRGRWLLLTYEIRSPGSEEVFYYSTQVYGYDDGGLVLDLFDTAGSFRFRGTVPEEGTAQFKWRDGDERRLSTFVRRGDDTLDFAYEHAPAGEDPSVFTGPWRRA